MSKYCLEIALVRLPNDGAVQTRAHLEEQAEVVLYSHEYNHQPPYLIESGPEWMPRYKLNPT